MQHVALLSPAVSHLFLLSTRAQSTWWYRLPALSALFNMGCQMYLASPTDYPLQASYTLPNLFSPEFLDRDGNRERLTARYIQIRERYPLDPNAFSYQLGAVQSHELTAEECRRLRESGIKIFAMSGNADRMIHHWNTEKMRDDLNADVTIVDGAGHSIATELSAQVNEWLMRGMAS